MLFPIVLHNFDSYLVLFYTIACLGVIKIHIATYIATVAMVYKCTYVYIHKNLQG